MTISYFFVGEANAWFKPSFVFRLFVYILVLGALLNYKRGPDLVLDHR